MNNKWVYLIAGVLLGAVVAPRIRAFVPLPTLKG